MSLETYNKKRDFTKSPEPPGKIKNKKSSLHFVVQRHKASTLHYDFRLELEGVLKSWAVPKGPSMNPEDKRLAIMVEDHPYDYKDFEGTIPEGYGAGIVEIWDKGEYTNLSRDEHTKAEEELKSGLKQGSLKFILSGEKLKGEFALVKLKGKDDKAWLLIKHKDQFAVNRKYNSEKETSPGSPINRWLAKNQKSKKKN